MSGRTNRVVLVLDPEYGDKIAPLAATSHVWVIDTPANRAAASEYWGAHPRQNVESTITTFKSTEIEARRAVCLGILDSIDLHHGKYSSDPPYSVLDVIGLPLARKVKRAIRDLGFRTFEATVEGFRARR